MGSVPAPKLRVPTLAKKFTQALTCEVAAPAMNRGVILIFPPLLKKCLATVAFVKLHVRVVCACVDQGVLYVCVALAVTTD